MTGSLLSDFEFRRPFPLLRPGIDTCASTGSAHVALARDLSGLLPYLSALSDEVRFGADPPRASFLYEGRTCTLFPTELTVAAFHDEADARACVRRLLSDLEGLDRRRAELTPRFDLGRSPSVLAILRALPRTNCGACAQNTCTSFAVAVSQGATPPDRCPAMPAPVGQAALYPVFDRLGRLQEMVAVPGGPAAPEQAPAMPPHPLTDRELQVLELLSAGATNPEIARALDITPHTVKTHVTHIFDKLGVTDRTQAAVLAVRLGLV